MKRLNPIQAGVVGVLRRLPEDQLTAADAAILRNTPPSRELESVEVDFGAIRNLIELIEKRGEMDQTSRSLGIRKGEAMVPKMMYRAWSGGRDQGGCDRQYGGQYINFTKRIAGYRATLDLFSITQMNAAARASQTYPIGLSVDANLYYPHGGTGGLLLTSNGLSPLTDHTVEDLAEYPEVRALINQMVQEQIALAEEDLAPSLGKRLKRAVIGL